MAMAATVVSSLAAGDFNCARGSGVDEKVVASSATSRFNFEQDPLSMFSTTVTEADAKFVEVCGEVGGNRQFYDHRFKGKDGEPLRAAVCHYGPTDARGVIVTISGTHGAEGFAGSFAQIAAMTMRGGQLPPNYRAVHIHMINPYGASYIMKENEDNADQLKNYARAYDQQNFSNPVLVEFIDGLEMQPGNGRRTGHGRRACGRYGGEVR